MELLAHAEPAAGAPLEDLVPAAVVGALVVVAVGAFAWAHRSGRTRALARAAAAAERVSGLPGWTALPAAVAGVSLIAAVFGFYWDVATHIDNGRDPGPFANPSHYFIITGLAGIAVAGALSVAIGRKPSRSAVRVRAGWHAPVGGVLLLVCGSIAVLGFPLDDVWHRLFGQDVTLWSPTHLQMVGGAALSTLALWILFVEGGRAAADPRRARETARVAEPLIAGALLVGMSAFQAEFDYSVPQFRLLYHPVLLASSAGVALVAARIRLGRGGALKAVVFFIALRGALSVVVGPVFGHTTLHFPLYLVEALAVEALASVSSTDRQIGFGAAAGALIGTVGLAAEWLWSHLWMTIAWPASVAPEAIALAAIAGVAGGLLGGFIGRSLAERAAPRQRVPAVVGIAAILGVAFVIAYPLPIDGDVEGSVAVALSDAERGPAGWVDARVTVRPAPIADDAEWFNVTAWQGGGSVVEDLVETQPGIYRAGPIPVHGEWKALIRLHRGRSLVAVPIYLPKDPAIPAPEVPARTRFVRPFIPDERIVLREAKDVDESLTYGASAAVAAIALAWLMTLAWGLRRLDEPGPHATGPRQRLRASLGISR